MHPSGFEPNSEGPQAHTLDRAVTGIGTAKFGAEDFKTLALHKTQLLVDTI